METNSIALNKPDVSVLAELVVFLTRDTINNNDNNNNNNNNNNDVMSLIRIVLPRKKVRAQNLLKQASQKLWHLSRGLKEMGKKRAFQTRELCANAAKWENFTYSKNSKTFNVAHKTSRSSFVLRSCKPHERVWRYLAINGNLLVFSVNFRIHHMCTWYKNFKDTIECTIKVSLTFSHSVLPSKSPRQPRLLISGATFQRYPRTT